MSTSTYLANPTVFVGATTPGTDLTNQCVSAVLTSSRDALESTAFGSTGRSYVGGLTNVTCTLTFLMSYATSETYATLQPLIGAAATYIAVKPSSGAISATNPEFELTNAYLESLDVVNGALGELSQVEATFVGGTLVIDVTPDT
jgi:hypothetical protein